MQQERKYDSSGFGNEVPGKPSRKPGVAWFWLGGTRQGLGFIWGLVFVAVGLFLLLAQLGIVSSRVFFRYWPVLLILWGIGCLGKRESRAWGLILVTGGTVLQLNKLNILDVSLWDLWPLIFVAIGVMIIWNSLGGRKVAMPPAGDSIDVVNEVAVFSGVERRITNRQFQGGRLTSVFGGMEIDLRDASIEGSEAVLDLNVIFGSCEVRVPESWNVAIRVQPIFGGVEDRTRQSAPADPSSARKTLYLKGTVVFGGVEIRN